MGADFVISGLITILYCVLAFTKAKDSMNIYLTSGSDIILFTAEVTVKKKSVKDSFGPCIILLNDSVLLPGFSTLSQAFIAVIWHRDKV